MTMFVESPWPAVVVCTLLILICGVLFVRTGRAWAIVALAASVGLLVALVLLERSIITDREQVEDTLHGVANALEANDVPLVLSSFAKSCPGIRQAESALARVTVDSATVGRDLEVRINQLTSPPTATAWFTGRIQAEDKRGEIPYENFIRKFKLTLEYDGQRWLISNYQIGDLRSGQIR